MFADAHDEDVVVDASALSFAQFLRSVRPAPPFTSRSLIGAFAPASSLGARLGQNQLQDVQKAQEQRAVTRRGTYRCNQPRGVDAGFLSCAPTVPSRPTAV